jgi:hypothetical protein
MIKSKHVILLSSLLLGCVSFAHSSDSLSVYSGSGVVTQGRATTVIDELFQCEHSRSRVAAVGTISDNTGKAWTVPAANQYRDATHALNMYDDCSNNKPNSLNDIDIESVPIVEVDSDGDVVTGYLFADNYFELYINGMLIGVDAVPFTPFNSSIVRFKVKKPYTIAVKAIDWEENLGLGTESGRGKRYQPGDGGFIASFSDGTITGTHWQAQTFYISPIYDLSCLDETPAARLSSRCATDGVNDGEDAYAIHWSLPERWNAQDFEALNWPSATEYTEDQIGVDNKNGYMNFREQFTGSGARFIWTSNVILDNEVLFRYHVK